jgi:hypothetical protein
VTRSCQFGGSFMTAQASAFCVRRKGLAAGSRPKTAINSIALSPRICCRRACFYGSTIRLFGYPAYFRTYPSRSQRTPCAPDENQTCLARPRMSCMGTVPKLRESVFTSQLTLGVWAAEGTSAANWPQRFIFRRFLTLYLDIGLRNRQKLPSLGPIFASTSSAAQAPRQIPGDRNCELPLLFQRGFSMVGRRPPGPPHTGLRAARPARQCT